MSDKSEYKIGACWAISDSARSQTSCRALSASVRWSKTICWGSRVPQPMRNWHESHASISLVHNMAEIEGEISAESKIWTPVKDGQACCCLAMP